MADAWRTYQNTGNLLAMLGEVRALLQADPTAPGVMGRARVLWENAKVTLSPKSDKDTMVAALKAVDTANVSAIDLYKVLLTAQVALLNNPDGRISNSDWTAAAQALGFDKVLGVTIPIPTGTGIYPWKVGVPISTAADILPRLDVLEKMTRAKREDAGVLIGAPRPEGPPSAPARVPSPPEPPSAPLEFPERTLRFFQLEAFGTGPGKVRALTKLMEMLALAQQQED
jgi:hypothetical protein